MIAPDVFPKLCRLMLFQQLDQRLSQRRVIHADMESVRAAHCQQVLKFTLSSIALENKPVNPERLAMLLCVA